jgi:hypothetical protein
MSRFERRVGKIALAILPTRRNSDLERVGNGTDLGLAGDRHYHMRKSGKPDLRMPLPTLQVAT